MNISKKIFVMLTAMIIVMVPGLVLGQEEASEPVVSLMVTEFARSEAHLQDANLEAVAALLRAARTLDPSNKEAALLLAESLETIGDLPAATVNLDHYLLLGGQDEVVMAKRIYLAVQVQQTNEQRRGLLMNVLNQAGISNVLQSVLYQELAKLSFEASEDQIGNELLSKAISTDPFNVTARGKALELMGAKVPPVQQLPLLAQMVRANPLRLDVVWRFANALDQTGLHGEAQKWYKYALGVHLKGAGASEISEEELLDLGSSYVLSGNYDQAMLVLNRLANQNPARVDVEIWLARAQAGMGQQEEADKHLAIAEKLLLDRVQSKPSDLTGVVQTAWFYLIDKPSNTEAQVWAEKAIKLGPNDPKAQLCLGLAAIANGVADESTRESLEDLGRTDPWALLGLIRIMLAGEHTEEELSQAFQIAVSQQSGGWLGIAFRELAASQNMNLRLEEYLARLGQILANELGNAAELRDFYRHPQDYLHLKIRPEKPAFNYNEPVILNVSLTNMGSEAITMGPGMMLNPRLVLSAKLTGGLERELKYFDFVSMYERRALKPSEGLSASIRLDRGELGKLLRRIPQETITLRVSCILDPQPVGHNEYMPSLAGQISKELMVVRYGFVPRAERMDRLYRLAKDGPLRDRIFSTLLLGDLLGNNQFPHAIADTRAPQPVEKLRIMEVLEDAARDSNWRVRAWVGEAVRFAQLEPGLSKALAEQIQDEHWFVRLMAVRAAGIRGEDWNDILRQVVQTDANPLVRQMAEAYVIAQASESSE